MSPNVLNLPRIAGLRSAVVAAAHLLAVLGSCDLCLRFSCVLVPFETMQAYGASPEIIYEGKPFKEVRRNVVILLYLLKMFISCKRALTPRVKTLLRWTGSSSSTRRSTSSPA